MKVTTPEISWHAKEAIYSVDIQPKQENPPIRVATAGIDSNVRIWELTDSNKSGVTFLSNLTRHEKAVNIVRFSKSGKTLASGGDDGTVILWNLSDKTEAPNIFEDEADIGKNVENWNAFKILRGHIEDINDLSWSADEKFLVSGSIDHTAIMWDITKGCKLCILSEAKHFIHGVTWDPLGQYLAVFSCDRSLRIYNIKARRVIHNVSKMVYPEPIDDGCEDEKMEEDDITTAKSQRMFHDETVVRRRMEFTSDGNLLIVPSGCLTKTVSKQSEQINTAYIFARGCLSKPVAVLQGFKQPVTVIRCCPIKFKLRKSSENDESSLVDLPYRYIFAVAASDTLLLYDTQHITPFALIGNIHYAAITDVSWSSDGNYLVVSSRDGFCTKIQFDDNELGEEYTTTDENTDVTLCNGIDTMNTSNDDSGAVNDDSNSMELSQNDDARLKTLTVNESSSENNIANKDCSKTENIHQNIDGKVDANKNDLQKTETVPSLSQEKKSRRVPLTAVSQSPTESPKSQSTDMKGSRRVQLTTIQTSDSSQSDDKKTPSKTAFLEACNHASPVAVITPKSTTVAPKSSPATSNTSKQTKKGPRRIQLTTVDKS